MSPTSLKSLSVCAMEAASVHITLVEDEYWTRLGFRSSCDVASHAKEAPL